MNIAENFNVNCYAFNQKANNKRQIQPSFGSKEIKANSGMGNSNYQKTYKKDYNQEGKIAPNKDSGSSFWGNLKKTFSTKIFKKDSNVKISVENGVKVKEVVTEDGQYKKYYGGKLIELKFADGTHLVYPKRKFYDDDDLLSKAYYDDGTVVNFYKGGRYDDYNNQITFETPDGSFWTYEDYNCVRSKEKGTNLDPAVIYNAFRECPDYSSRPSYRQEEHKSESSFSRMLGTLVDAVGDGDIGRKAEYYAFYKIWPD